MTQTFYQRSFWVAAARGPVKFRERLERLGPTFVKFGQFLALRPDSVPDDYALELMRLFDEAPPFSWSEARTILREDLSDAAFESFAYIESVPITAASLVQVHAARLRSGEQILCTALSSEMTQSHTSSGRPPTCGMWDGCFPRPATRRVPSFIRVEKC